MKCSICNSRLHSSEITKRPKKGVPPWDLCTTCKVIIQNTVAGYKEPIGVNHDNV